MAEADASAVTRDAFFGGRLIVTQPACGHRSGTDAVLLAAAVPRDCAGLVYDIGAGVGVAGLGVALACPAVRVCLVEVDEASAALARANISENAMADRVTVAACDVLSREGRTTLPGNADIVVTNPPFHDPTRVRLSPNPGRRAAHALRSDATLSAWIAGCLDLLVEKGLLIVIHRARALPELLAPLGRRAGAVTLTAVHPRVGEAANRIILRASKGSRAPFAIAPPLVLHQGDAFTDEAERLHRGEAPLGW